MRIKPTMRKGGFLMCTFNIKIHIGLEDVVLALIHARTRDKPLPTTRQKAMRMAIEMNEEVRWQEIDNESMKEFGTECVDRAEKLFPDMLQGVDLTYYRKYQP